MMSFSADLETLKAVAGIILAIGSAIAAVIYAVQRESNRHQRDTTTGA